MPAVIKSWNLLAHDSQAVADLARSLRISPVVAQLLVNRRITDHAAARLFLDSPMTALHAPQLLPGIDAAADFVARAVADGRKICIYGDYDVDGTTGTAILLKLFRLLGAKAEFYVPNRIDEGYGLNCDAIRELAGTGVELIITVDCGIASLEEAEEAQRLNLALIITDHHVMKERLPVADVLVHPQLPGSTYPHDGLSGAGVAFKLAWAIAQRASGSEKVAPKFRDFLLDTLGLAAMGIVADVVPLLDENRVFVRHGLERITKHPSPGLKALIEAAGLKPNVALKAEDIGFKLGPRLNAAGRLECARLVVELLTTDNPIRARELAEYLENLNTQRQGLERRITQQAKDIIEAQGYHHDAGLVVSAPEWHAGVVGIVASRLVDHYGKPTLVIAEKEDGSPSTGSGRSVAGFPLHLALQACGSELITHGGHAAAAGFKVLPVNIDALRAKFSSYVSEHFNGQLPKPILRLEAEVPLSALTFSLLKDLDRLEPYGAENPRPRFLATGLKVEGTPRRIGKEERHLSFRIRQGDTLMRAVAFGMGDRLEELMSENGNCCLVFTPKLNEWNGQRTVEMEVNDLRAGLDPQLA